MIILEPVLSKAKPTIVHIDAKIINRDDKDKPKRTFVAYVIEDGDEKEFEEIKAEDASETDAAELYAIDFAIRRLRHRRKKFVLLCDHESVTLVLQQTLPKFTNKTRPIMEKVWNLLQNETNFVVKPFPVNQADRFLNARWNEIKAGSV